MSQHLKVLYIALCDYSNLSLQIHYTICYNSCKSLIKANGDVVVYTADLDHWQTRSYRVLHSHDR